jgi:hypothetical protein
MFYSHNYPTQKASAAEAALTLMRKYQVPTYAALKELTFTENELDNVNRLEAYEDIVVYLRVPIKNGRSKTPAATIAVCPKCQGWQTVAMKAGAADNHGPTMTITDAARKAVDCIATTGCHEEQIIVMPAEIDKNTDPPAESK